MSGAARDQARRLAWMAGGVFLLDQLTKLWIVEVLDLAGRFRVEVLPGYVTLIMAWNRGVNFGILASDAPAMRFGLALLAVVVSVGVAIWALRRGDRWFGLGAGLLVGGALGNAVDRLRYGAVADFLNVTCCGIVNPYAFNVADIAIFAGAVALALSPTPAGGNARPTGAAAGSDDDDDAASAASEDDAASAARNDDAAAVAGNDGGRHG